MRPSPIRESGKPESRSSRLFSRAGAVALTVVWLAAVGWGFVHILHYEGTPGRQGGEVFDPAALRARVEPRKFMLVVALHPECPCSRATVEAIDRLVAERPDRMAVHGIFLDTAAGGGRPEASGLWARLGRVPGATVHKDVPGGWCGGDGFRTSGEAILYGPDGDVRFHGGLTIARGHQGPSRGYAAVLAAIDGSTRAGEITRTPVFGCSLSDPDAEEAAGS